MGRRKAKPSDTPAAETQSAPLPASLVRERVVFVHPHRHAGKEFATGDSFMATPRERELFRQFGAIEAD